MQRGTSHKAELCTPSHKAELCTPEQVILIVDDEPDMLTLLKRSLEPELNCKVETAPSGETGLHMLAKQDFDLVLTDIKMPGMDGLEFLERIKQDLPDLTVVMMTAFGSIDIAVKAMRNGAYDFITKPFEHDALVLRLEKALERSRLLRENRRLQRECADSYRFQDLVGKSPGMRQVYETIRMVANTDMTVLITGESGTGKELAARAVHSLGNRRQKPFVAVNCPTVPENILESELFGYRKGAFTHATQNRIGLFQEAHHGSLFLDEIGDISPGMQAKLLRVLQEKRIKPLGDTKAVSVDVRIIAATNRNLREKMGKGEFREDLFYRLDVVPIRLPPLRDRREDIPLIASHLLEKHCKKLDKPPKTLCPELMDILMGNPWEGNVRELENVIMRGIMFSPGDEITPRYAGFKDEAKGLSDTADAEFQELSYKAAKEETLKRFNSSYIGSLLAQNRGNVTRAAKRCGLERQSLQQIMRRYGIRSDVFRKG